MKTRRVIPLVMLLVLALVVANARGRNASELEPSRHLASPSAAFPLGCGEGGIDLLAALAVGVGKAILLAGAVSIVAMVLGTTLGAFAAQRRGWLERLVERASELTQAFPTIVLALVVVSSVKAPTRFHLAVVFSLTAWAGFARLALAETRVLREAAFIEASRALGRGDFALLLRHLLPQLMPVAGVQWGATAAGVVISEASLGFLGFIAPGEASLGELLGQGVVTMLRAPHILFVAAFGVLLTSSCLLLAGMAVAGESRSRAP